MGWGLTSRSAPLNKAASQPATVLLGGQAETIQSFLGILVESGKTHCTVLLKF